MWQLLVVVVMAVVYFGLQEVVSRSRLPVLWAIFLVTPLVLTTYWLKTNSFDFFVWIKIYSVMLGVSWAGWLRFTTMGDKPWLRRSIAWLLAANIAEATILDLLVSGITHQFNALAGILLVATIPFSFQSTRIDRADRHQTLRFDVPLAWICGYTFWNWSFVYLNYPAYVGHHTAILSAALMVGILDPQRWLQARAATLGMNLIWMATSNTGLLAVSNTPSWFSESIATVAASFALSWMLVHTASKLWTHFASEKTLAISQTVRQQLERVTTEWKDTESAVISWCVN